jgi:integrase
MTKPLANVVDKRAIALNTNAAVLPIDRRDLLAELLTDEDVETLRCLVDQGMGDNTLRAIASDLAYLEAWSRAATGEPLPWPAPEALLLKFVAHHLWDPAKRETDPNHGMPAAVEASLCHGRLLKVSGPHAASTIRRRLAHWSTLTRWRGLEGVFTSPALKSAFRLAVRAVPRSKRPKSTRAVTADVLAKLISTCSRNSLRDIRDRALLMLAFASGGRRRNEVASLRIEQLQQEEPVVTDDGKSLPSLSIHLGRTKIGNGDDVVYLTGRPVEALQAWIAASIITSGSLFCGIDRWGTPSRRPLDPKSINDIVKHRAALAGLNPSDYSAHCLRSGYLTEAANRGVPLPEAMQQSRHSSVQQASSYYNNADQRTGQASRLLD